MESPLESGDNWIPRVPNMKPSGSVRACRLRRVSQLMRQGTNEWDEGMLRRYFYTWDVDEILKIRLPVNKISDWVARQYEKTGIFSVRSAYRSLALRREHDLVAMGTSGSANGERGVWKKIWKLPVIPKVRNFFWKLIKNGLPTNANRHYRHITDNAACEMCGAVREDGFHAVIECPHAKTLREAMRKVWHLPEENRLRNTGPEWMLVLLDTGTGGGSSKSCYGLMESLVRSK
jgi:hypothetical protein